MYKKNLVIRSPEIAELLRDLLKLVPDEKKTKEIIQRVLYWRDYKLNPPYPILAIPPEDVVITLSSDGALEATCPLASIVEPLKGSEVTEDILTPVILGNDVVDLPAERGI